MACSDAVVVAEAAVAADVLLLASQAADALQLHQLAVADVLLLVSQAAAVRNSAHAPVA